MADFAPGATDLLPTLPLSAILDLTLADNGGLTRTHLFPEWNTSQHGFNEAAANRRGKQPWWKPAWQAARRAVMRAVLR